MVEGSCRFIGHKTDCDFWGYHGQPFYSEDHDPVLKLQNQVGMSGNHEAHRPMHSSLWNPREFPIQAQSKPWILAEVQPWNRLGKTRWKRRRILSPKKSQANRRKFSHCLGLEDLLGFLGYQWYVLDPQACPFFDHFVVNIWQVDFTMAPMKALTTTMTTTTTTMKAMMIKEGKKEWRKDWAELNWIKLKFRLQIRQQARRKLPLKRRLQRKLRHRKLWVLERHEVVMVWLIKSSRQLLLDSLSNQHHGVGNDNVRKRHTTVHLQHSSHFQHFPRAPTIPAKAACATCGLFGHEASACPFAHPEESERGSYCSWYIWCDTNNFLESTLAPLAWSRTSTLVIWRRSWACEHMPHKKPVTIHHLG